MPSGWRLVSVDDIRSPEPHSCVAGPFGSNISSKFFTPSGVPVIRGGNLRDDLTRFVPSGFAFVSAEQAQQYRAQHVRAGDLVFTCWGTIGQVGLIPADGPFSEYIISNKQLKLRPDPAKTDHLYLFYHFASPQMVGHIKGKAIGAAVPGINLGILKSLPVALPPLSIQRRIASILSAYDDLIENNRKRIAILEDMARRLYREWFVHFRYPGHESVPLVDSPLGRIPQGWVWSRLADIADVNRRQLSPANAPEAIRYIDIASVSPGIVDTITPMAFADAPGRARRIVGDGDILWSCVRPNRRSHALVLDPDPNTIASTGFAVLSSRSVPWTYLYQTTTTDAFVGYLVGRAQGAAYPAVRADDFLAADVLMPSQDLLSQFHRMVEPWARLEENLRQQNTVLRRTRDLILPRLMSGTLSVEALATAEAAAP